MPRCLEGHHKCLEGGEGHHGHSEGLEDALDVWKAVKTSVADFHIPFASLLSRSAPQVMI